MSYAMGNRPPAHDGAAPADEEDNDDAVQTLWRVVYQEGTSLNLKNKGLHDKGGAVQARDSQETAPTFSNPRTSLQHPSRCLISYRSETVPCAKKIVEAQSRPSPLDTGGEQ